MSKPGFMLHVCCAPCSTHVVELLSAAFEITGLFYNPNIHPRGEYDSRLAEARRYFMEKGLRLLTPAYAPRKWFSCTRGHEKEREGGERCALCFRMRIEATAREASSRGFAHFGSTLSISPHKNAELINRIGTEVGNRHGIRFYEADFKKGAGFQRSCELSKRHGLSRQRYCGCVFSSLKKNR